MLPPPGNVTPMPEENRSALPSTTTEKADDDTPAEVVVMQDAAALPVNSGFQAGQDEDDADVVITGPADMPPPLPGAKEEDVSYDPPPSKTAAQAEPVSDIPPLPSAKETPPSLAEETPPPPSATAPPPPATIAAHSQQDPAPATTAAVPAPAGVNTSNISKALVEAGFEGLELGFGAFPMVTLQNTEFSTSDGISLGHEFFAVIHSSRKKYLLKANRGRDEEEFTYSYDKITTIGGKSVDEVKQEWLRSGYESPEWKEYLDVTAQLIDIQKRTIDQMVLLSIPHSSNARLSGYITTILTSGTSPADVVTHVHLGQQVTAAKKPFYPWAFKKYALLGEVVQQ